MDTTEPPGNIRSLFPEKPSAAPLPADPEVIAALESMVEDAKAGQIIAFTGAVYNGAGFYQLLAVGKVSLANSLGTLDILKFTLLRNLK